MKKKLIVLLLAITIFNCSCKEETIKEEYKPIQSDLVYERGWVGIHLIIIDSCEYLQCDYGDHRGGVSLIHKQNCKNCKNVKK